ncbi:aminopeptidase P family protein [Aestuariivirga sp.]|uniref:aminopeptidase P family protein n=1 Tax=Aestuariivirga sp. TaxID=2650926 RepID=UPI0039E42C5E
MPSSPSSARVAALRAELKKRKLTGLIIPRQDEFQGEYVAAYAERLRWLTGFAGSWGTAILTLTKGAIFVDGRYTIQVRQQVDDKTFVPNHLAEEPPAQWIAKTLKKGDVLGVDPWLLTAADADRYAAACAGVGAKLVSVTHNPIDAIWKDQPARPMAEIAAQPTQFAGRSAKEKLEDVSADLTKLKADAVVLALPDSVAWVFNLRGFDVPYTPVVLAYAILHRKRKAELFINSAKLPEDVTAQLKALVTIRKPSDIEASLKKLGTAKKTVAIDVNTAPSRVRDVLKKAGAKIVNATDPCIMPKARKNRTEQQGARAAQLRDGAAMARFLRWIEETAPQGGVTEMSAAERLAEFRKETGVLMDLSFSSIAGAGPNAAIPHYHVTEESSRPLERNQIFLIDSGGQYQDGTTDITRTTIIGQPTDDMKDRFTRVLKGMIDLSRIRFPKGTCGSQLDVLARGALWTAGLDFDHGTGHGVGSYLSVHEGPARINKSDRTPLEPGMILSNEPGFYRQGEYGIRIENLLLVTEPEEIEGGERRMMGFETLTLCPIERRLIEVSLLAPEELVWLNAYHARVLKEVGALLDSDDLLWLEKMCAPL